MLNIMEKTSIMARAVLRESLASSAGNAAEEFGKVLGRGVGAFVSEKNPAVRAGKFTKKQMEKIKQNYPFLRRAGHRYMQAITPHPHSVMGFAAGGLGAAYLNREPLTVEESLREAIKLGKFNSIPNSEQTRQLRKAGRKRVDMPLSYQTPLPEFGEGTYASKNTGLHINAGRLRPNEIKWEANMRKRELVSRRRDNPQRRLGDSPWRNLEGMRLKLVDKAERRRALRDKFVRGLPRYKGPNKITADWHNANVDKQEEFSKVTKGPITDDMAANPAAYHKLKKVKSRESIDANLKYGARGRIGKAILKEADR